MRATQYVYTEVNAGRMTVEQGMAHLDREQQREAAWARWSSFWSWAAVTVVCIALFAACLSWANTPPLEQLPDTMLSQAQAAAQADATEAVAEEARTESMVLKLIGILIVPIGGLLTVLLGLLTTWVKSKAAGSKFAGGMTVLLELLGAHIAKARAELVPELQAALADGVLDAREREALKKKLIALLLRDAPADALKAVQAVFGESFSGWLEGKAQQAIDSMAVERGAKTSP